MRTAFIKELFELAKQDERIVLVVGDLGFGVVTPFMEQLPKQFINAGVAEQNMTGLAAGMALSGKIALTYSIAISQRCVASSTCATMSATTTPTSRSFPWVGASLTAPWVQRIMRSKTSR